ncbi:MAG TPA: DUF4026 domain-containing protein [Myxococcales bacterium]|nr:DUF4026 domain-containing protein [Myxococcales bacterium]
MSWWKLKRPAPQAGSVLFRGRWVARPEDFAFLERRGIQIGPPTRPEGGGWSLPLEHREWGRAKLLALPDMMLPPGSLVDLDHRLDEEEKSAVRGCGSALAMSVEPRTGNVLADRKDLLRFLHAALGEEGIGAVDHLGQAFWSRAALEEELAHGAELDIDNIYTIHLMYDPEQTEQEKRGYWLHTHGLRGLGFHDFDVLDPADEFQGHAHELSRALAFASVEGRLTANRPVDLVVGVQVRPVPAREFLAQAAASEHRKYRETVDDEHLDGHLVLCDPAPTGWISRLMGRSTVPRPSGFLRGPFPDEVLIQFSDSATELMASRARLMLAVFRNLATELAEFDFPALVKLGFQIDGGSEGQREHLWFQVHGFKGDSVDATLINAPFQVGRLRVGQRGLQPLELLSDWSIMTPFGHLNPRQTRTLRTVRKEQTRLREIVAELRSKPT